MEEDFPLDGSEYTDNAIRQCPAFANNGCFMASMVTWGEGKDTWGPNSFNKGCSMLDLGDMELDCIENPDVGYQSCKCKTSESDDLTVRLTYQLKGTTYRLYSIARIANSL